MNEQAQLLIAQLRTFEGFLVKSARDNTPVESFLDVLEVALDDTTAPILDQIMARPDWQVVLFGHPLPPDVQPWLDSFHHVYTHPETVDGAETDETPAGEPPGSVAGVAPHP